MSNPFQLELLSFLQWLLSKHPSEVEGVSYMVKDTARRNEKRPAYVTHLVPDDWVVNIKGDSRLRDSYVSFRIPKELVQEWKALKNAPAGLQDALGGSEMVKEG